MQESNERYRRLVELSPDGIFISQDGPDRVRESRRGAPVRRRPRRTRCWASRCSRCFTPTATRSFASASPLLPGHIAPLVEEKIVRLDGSVADVEVTSTLLEEEGRAIQVIVRDITQRKRTETALRESEERLTLAFAGAQEGVWDWNLETGAVVYSSRWKEMLGYARRRDRAARQRVGAAASSRRQGARRTR